MKRFLLFVLFFVGIASLVSNAQSLAIGPQFGLVKSTDADNTSVMPGLALRLNLLAFGVEGSIYYKSEEFQNGEIKTKSYPINITAFWKIIPIAHAEAGIGWYNTKIDFSHPIESISSETKSKAGFHIGAGAQIPAGNIMLTGDIRYVFLDLSSAVSFKSNFYVIMIGAMFTI